MPAWGVDGGGPKNEQAVSDLVAYLKSIQLSPAKAQAQVLKKVATFKDAGRRQAVEPARGQPRRRRRRTSTKAETAQGPARLPRSRSRPRRTRSPAREAYEAQIANDEPGRAALRRQVRPLPHQGLVVQSSPTSRSCPMPAPAGSGAFGPSLRDGSTLEQFPPRPTTHDAGLPEAVRLGRGRRRGEQGLRRARHLDRPHGALRQHPDQGADRRDHRVRAEPVVGEHAVKTLVLAAEGIKDRDLWYPTILGVLVVIAAVSLFMRHASTCCSPRTWAHASGSSSPRPASSGFMVLLSLLWLTNPSPLNTLKGRIPTWKAVEASRAATSRKSKIPAVRDIDEGRPAERHRPKHQPQGRGRPRHPHPGAEPPARIGRRRQQVRRSTRRPPTTSTPSNYETGGGKIFSRSRRTSTAGSRWSTSACTSRSTRW